MEGTWPRSERGSEGTGQGLGRRLTPRPHSAVPPRVAQAHSDTMVPVTALVASKCRAQPEPASQVAECRQVSRQGPLWGPGANSGEEGQVSSRSARTLKALSLAHSHCHLGQVT